jgi:plastocyanin
VRVGAPLLVALTGAALAAAPIPAAAAGRTFTVEISRLAYGPLPATLHRGDTIEWVNADIFRHTATARNKSFDVDLAPKAHARTVLRTTGAVAFYCRYHPGMTGTLQVAP